LVDVIKLEVTEGVVWYMLMGGEPPLGEQRRPIKSWTCLLSSASIRLEDAVWQSMMIIGSSVLAACCEEFDETGGRSLYDHSFDHLIYSSVLTSSTSQHSSPANPATSLHSYSSYGAIGHAASKRVESVD
jgi:hypothetical protein